VSDDSRGGAARRRGTSASETLGRRHVEPALAERSRRQLRSGREVEPLEDSAQVGLDGLGADPEPRPDLVIRAAVDDQPHDVELALAQPANRRARRTS